MSPIRSITLLLLSALVTLTIAAGPDCPAIGDTNRDTTNYTLTVSPSDLSKSTVYTVTFNSTIPVNGSVLLEVISNNTSNGSWSSLPSGFQNCTGAIYGNYTSGSPITANWTSPTALTSTSVQFRALLNDQFGQSKVDKPVSVAATSTANPTTSHSTNSTPTAHSTVTTANSTTVSMAPNSTANHSSTTVMTTSTSHKPTNGGHATHQAPMFFTLMETFIFLAVTGKLLS